MTSALVVPVSGYSTLSRFDRVSRRPSTSTVVPGTGGPRPRGARSCRLTPGRGLRRLGRLRRLRGLGRLRGPGGLRGAARPAPRPGVLVLVDLGVVADGLGGGVPAARGLGVAHA